ncbi:MAG: ribosome recycling factor [Candidatus Portnoybacteria bacterium]|nr:ribosome recycling factor [Candidatus Portnoybacteria bacterium]
MVYKQIIEKIKPELEKAIEFLKSEFVKIKTSRANPAMVEDIKVDCYGQSMPIKQLANINVPQSRTIVIQPWDKSVLGDVEKAIRNSSSLSPVVDGDIIRINIPVLSEEQRKEYVKIIADKAEEAKISIKLHREEAWKKIQEMEREGEITEDEKFKAKDELQKLVDEYNGRIEEMKKKKEEDVMAV